MGARLLIAVLYHDGILLDKLVTILEKQFGNIIDSMDYAFDVTDYYEQEMGIELRRRLLVFEKSVVTNELADVKHEMMRLEDTFSVDSKRQLNIDPGYIAKDGFVLASTKGKSYKKEIDSGIFEHRILGFEGDKVLVYFHTFPDFRKVEVQQFLLSNRHLSG